jgi:glycosyltransferase involved in cell wall biosynthesis
MNIALVTDRFSTGGGLEHLFQVVRAMPDVRFAIFAGGGDAAGRFSGLDNVRPFPEGYSPRRILGFDPRVIHFHHLKPLLRFCSDPLPRKRPPLVFTVHGLHLHKYEFLPGRRAALLRFGRLSLERTLLSRVDRVVAVSREDEEFLRNKHGLANTVCIPNGIDPAAARGPLASREETRRALGVPHGGKLFLTVARFDRQKGYDVLVRAIGLGRERFRKERVRFVLAGAGPEFRAVSRLAARAGVEDDILFAGERRDVHALMQASDLLILPSRWEGLPIVLLEASLWGLPIVCSDTYGNREFVRDSGRGILFRNEDHADLCRVLSGILERGGGGTRFVRGDPESVRGDPESGREGAQPGRGDPQPGSAGLHGLEPRPDGTTGLPARYDIAHTCARLRSLYEELRALAPEKRA